MNEQKAFADAPKDSEISSRRLILSETALTNVAVFGGLLVAAIGAAVLFGWAFHIQALKSVLPNTVSMKANSALCLVLIGLAIAITARTATRGWRRFALVLASATMTVSALTLLEYALHADFHIDQLLFLEDPSPIGTSDPGRMAMNAAIVLFALGFVIVAARMKATSVPRQLTVLMLVCFFFVYLAFIDYLLGTRALTGMSNYTRLAPHTAVALMFAIAAALFLPFGHRLATKIFSDSIAGTLLRRFLPFALVMPVLLDWILESLITTVFLDLRVAFAASAVFTVVIFSFLLWEYALYVDRDAEKARRIAELKDQFLFIAAHELKAPVTVVKWGAEFVSQRLDDGVQSDKIKKTLQDIHDNADRLAALVNDLLDTSRMEYGAFQVEAADIDLNYCVATGVENTREMAAKAGIRVNVEIPGNPVKAFSDCRRVCEIVLNLLTNAIKYNSHGGWVDITIAANDERASINVSDNGIGLSHDDIGRLFQRFSRIDRDETRDTHGTGLGLFIVDRITRRLGGTVTVTSPGRGLGSTFIIDLPLRYAQPTE